MYNHKHKLHRQSTRLKDYDYSQAGGYFVTIVIQNRKCLFGEIEDGEIKLSSFGKIINFHWNNIPQHFPYVKLDEFIIMPNHIHGIINIIENNVGAMHSIEKSYKNGNIVQENASPLQPIGTKPRSLSAVIQNYKSVTCREINRVRKSQGKKLWQRSFYDHVIRNETELNNIREYIIYNTVRWDRDKENPDRL